MSTTDDADALEVPERAAASAWNIGYFYLHHSTLSALIHWQVPVEVMPGGQSRWRPH